ncbi:ferritin-like domain-containing protein [archaeon]|nr:ferritin-like domain-containing protein [archaeon]
MFNAYRCKICGETYLGAKEPENCPFCGAHKHYMKTLAHYNRIKPKKISEKSGENILAAIELEVDNAKFYACAKRKSTDENETSVFKRLSKVETEHAEALAKLMDINPRKIPVYDECNSDPKKLYEEAHKREDRAIKHYSKFAQEAKEPEIKKFFQALVEIESDHLALSKKKTR